MKRLLGAVVISLLLQGCVSTNDQEEIEKQEKESETMTEQLVLAAENGEIEVLRNLVEAGADTNAQDANGRTAVMIATYNNDIEAVKLLVEAGADVNIQDDMKNNPLLYAGAEGFLEILKLTINAGADPTITNRYGGTALIPASEHGYVDVVKELLTNTDIDVNHVNNLGWTALMEAVILNDGNDVQQQTVQVLIDHGADVNIPDNKGITPLQHAREKGFKEMEQLLLKVGAE